MVRYYDSKNKSAASGISRNLKYLLHKEKAFERPIIITCIGSDRSTGDSLGPIIGYKLSKLGFSNIYIYGSLKAPIHASNLEISLMQIKQSHENPYIIAIDASLGKKEHVGFITLGTGPLKPGLGVKKELPEVGDLHITGIVNFTANKNGSLLQTTRLYTIMNLADIITNAIALTFNDTHDTNVCPYMLPELEKQYQQFRISYTNKAQQAYPDS